MTADDRKNVKVDGDTFARLNEHRLELNLSWTAYLTELHDGYTSGDDTPADQDAMGDVIAHVTARTYEEPELRRIIRDALQDAQRH